MSTLQRCASLESTLLAIINISCHLPSQIHNAIATVRGMKVQSNVSVNNMRNKLLNVRVLVLQ